MKLHHLTLLFISFFILSSCEKENNENNVVDHSSEYEAYLSGIWINNINKYPVTKGVLIFKKDKTGSIHTIKNVEDDIFELSDTILIENISIKKESNGKNNAYKIYYNHVGNSSPTQDGIPFSYIDADSLVTTKIGKYTKVSEIKLKDPPQDLSSEYLKIIPGIWISDSKRYPISKGVLIFNQDKTGSIHSIKNVENNVYDLSDTLVINNISVKKSENLYSIVYKYYDENNVQRNEQINFENLSPEILSTIVHGKYQKAESISIKEPDPKPEKESLILTVNNSEITFSYTFGSITGYINQQRGYTGNNHFNFKNFKFNGISANNGDDSAPMHAMGTTIGANHGYPISRVTIQNHRKTNKDIGSEWTNAQGIKFYIMRIISESEIDFLSENRGTKSHPRFTDIKQGDITRNGETLTITAISVKQLYPSIKNITLKIFRNGNEDIKLNGSYESDYVDIVESYEIMSIDDILNEIKSRSGTDVEPTYQGSSMVKVKNTYRFLSNATTLVLSDIEVLDNMEFRDFMFSQAVKIAPSPLYYVPNSISVGSFDFSKPVVVPWSSSLSKIYFGSSTWNDKQNPPNRVIQYTDDLGFSLGFLKESGVGKSLQNYTDCTFELRNNTGKVYPHGVEGTKVGKTLYPGEKYSSIMYRSYMNIPKVKNSGRMSYYNFNYNNSEYIFVDYSASMSDHIDLNNLDLEGKTIEIVESLNTTLKKNKYQNGIFIDAKYRNGESCYIVLKIKF